MLHAIVPVLSVCAQCRLVQVMHQPKPKGSVCACVMRNICRDSNLPTTVVNVAHAPQLMLGIMLGECMQGCHGSTARRQCLGAQHTYC